MKRWLLPSVLAVLVAGCAHAPPGAEAPPMAEYHGTLERFAANAVYFVVTDRFVNGDPGNDRRDQGGPDPERRTFDRPTPGAGDSGDNIGYLGGDFRGLLDNAGYIRDMGFGAVWLTPIVDNPDEAFTGGDSQNSDALFKDRGKTGRVLRTEPANDRVYVEGLNIQKRHQRPTSLRDTQRAQELGGVIEVEGPIHVSNVMLIDPKDNKPTRVRIERRDGRRVRVAAKSGQEID